MKIRAGCRWWVRLLFGGLASMIISGSAAAAPADPSAEFLRTLPRFISSYSTEGAHLDLWLTVVHNNDGESDLLQAGVDGFGGVDRFNSVVDLIQYFGRIGTRRAVLTVSSGDNFLAGPEFNLSLEKGPPFYDSIALDQVGYDALAIGNHEFDFGPDVLADFIEGFARKSVFLSANLDVSAEPRLQALAEAGIIAPSTVVWKSGRRIGIVGATTPNLPFISSPRNVVASPAVAELVQAEIDQLTADGVDVIVFISHLQNINEDFALTASLRGVDIMVAGGGSELLANPGSVLIPGDENQVFGPYPLFAEDADGRAVPVVTTSGNYGYVGRLVAGFDRDGNLVAIDPVSGPIRVAGTGQAGAVRPDPYVRALVTDPVATELDELRNTEIAVTEVDLDGRTSQVRYVETNEGNLIADAVLWTARRLAAAFGVPSPQVALQNGGGIRNNSIIPAGSLTGFDLFGMLPFANFVAVAPELPASQLKEILENAVSRAAAGDSSSGTGRFAQVAGMRFTWDPTGIPIQLDSAGNVLTPGTRIVDAWLDDGTPLVLGGAIVYEGTLSVASIDFLIKGGDQYPFRGAPFVTLGVTYYQALLDYVLDGLGGEVTAADYPEGGEGRITRLP